MASIVEFQNITKTFGGSAALKDVSFEVEEGKVHVLIGENGAGKSTLLKILTGLYHNDAGEILYKNKPLHINHPNQAMEAGIAMVYQELSVLPNMIVLDNVYLSGHSKHLGKRVDRRALGKDFTALQERYGIYVDPYELTGNLSIAMQQKVEILKMLSRDPDVIVLDEPTSVLPKDDVEILFEIIRNLIKNGKTVIFISHRMEEIFEIGDRVTVLKDGQCVATVNIEDTNVDEIIKYMVGRELKDVYPHKNNQKNGAVVYEVKNINYGKRVKNVSFQVHEGEILGIAGLQGHGQSELLRILSGNLPADSGEVTLRGKEMKLSSQRRAIRNGVGYVPENRKEQGLFLGLNVRENMAMSSIWMRTRAGFLDLRAEKQFVGEGIRRFDIRTSGMEQKIIRLSGGNQQKVILGKVLASNPQVLIFNEPTRGIDVQTKYEIYKLMRELAEEGVTVIMYSSDMMEVIGVSDSVIVMYEGEMTNHLFGDDITEDKIMANAVGIKHREE